MEKSIKRAVGIWALAGLLGTVAYAQVNDKFRDEISAGKDSRTKREVVYENRLENFAKYTGAFEGRRNRVYDPRPKDGKTEPTIGIGHYLDRGNSRQTFARVLPQVNYDQIYNGNATLTNEQIDVLFTEDLKAYVKRAEDLVPNFNKFPVSVQTALVDMTYRGDLGDSPKMRKLLNEFKIREAADEYINREEYKTAKVKNLRGIKIRMDSNRKRLLNYAESLDK